MFVFSSKVRLEPDLRACRSERHGLLGPDFKLAMMVFFGPRQGISACDSLQILEDSRADFINGRAQVVEFLRRKWNLELDYRLRKTLWALTGNRIAVRFEYEFDDDSGQWFRAYGNENWEFDGFGYMKRRFASINDLPIKEADRKFRWERKT